ncbi:MAG: TonB-dependent receptor domain-containing protein [bacterium]
MYKQSVTKPIGNVARIATFLLLSAGILLAQGSEVTISGKVTDEQTGDVLPGASVYVKNTYAGIAAGTDGNFTLKTIQPTPFTLVISMIGYKTHEMEITGSRSDLNIALGPKAFMANDIVVSASRVEENILRAPVSVEKMDLLEIRRSPSATLYDGLANMKEVTLTANSMTFSSITGRGFGGTINRGFIQLVDGVDNRGIANGQFAIGNMLGIADIDVADVELLPGASSALYGPNAYSGVMFMNSKSPFDFQGLSVQLKSGGTNSDYGGSHPFTEAAMRYARAYDKFAIKVVASNFQATDWAAHDFSDRNGVGIGSPGYNGVNTYGDEIESDFDLDALAGTPAGTFGSIHVARTGYREEDLYDQSNVFITKVNASLQYRPNENLQASYDFRYGRGNGIYQGTNRYALNGINGQYHKLELSGSRFYLRSYMFQEGAGDAYDVVFSGWNVNRRWKSDAQWFGEYLPTYIGALATGNSPAAAEAAARAVADRGRFMPGTPEFSRALEEVIETKDFRTGAGFISESRFYNTEAMYDFQNIIPTVNLQIGGNYRFYDVNTGGTIYSDATESIDVYEFGVYGQLSKSFAEDKLKLTGSLRLDGHQNFDDHISPRIAAVFSPTPEHNFRASFQSGFNNPVIESQYIFLNLGPIVLLGGTQDNVERTGLQRIYDRGISIDTFQPVKTSFRVPEFQKTFELGYKALVANNLFIDLSYYQADYTDRFKSIRVLDPDSLAVGTILPYALYTNELDENVILRGTGLALTYNFDKGYRLSTNYNFIERAGGSVDILENLNRAKHSVKVIFGNPRLVKNFGFNIAGRWNSDFHYSATFGAGEVEGATIIDAQLTYRLAAFNSSIKAGINNLTGESYHQAFGSVDIGTTFYVTLTYDSFFN